MFDLRLFQLQFTFYFFLQLLSFSCSPSHLTSPHLTRLFDTTYGVAVSCLLTPSLARIRPRQHSLGECSEPRTSPPAHLVSHHPRCRHPSSVASLAAIAMSSNSISSNEAGGNRSWRGKFAKLTSRTYSVTEHANNGHDVDLDAAGATSQGVSHEYRTYKRRWFGLVQLTLMNIMVSWNVRLLCISPQSISLPTLVLDHSLTLAHSGLPLPRSSLRRLHTTMSLIQPSTGSVLPFSSALALLLPLQSSHCTAAPGSRA